MGVIRNEAFYSSYLGDQIDLLLAAMAQANPLPSGTDWVAFIGDCRAAQTAAESAQTVAEAAAAAAETWSSNPPYIDPTTGDWFVYNTQTQQFVNSGVHAQGPQGATGADGVSPKVTTTTITGGHRVTITDADHPGGQSFDVMDGGMQSSTYDPQGTVASAGGIPNYVEAQVPTAVEKAAWNGKQDKLSGTQGQIVGFDANGNAVAQTAPATGVISFNGRTGVITPENGDYTAGMVGAASTSELNAVAGNIAPIESAPTASQTYAVGSYLVYNGLLYRVTAAIAQGDTITPGTNCMATTSMGELATYREEVAQELAKRPVALGSDVGYYVDPTNGSDSNAGTSDEPFATINAALNKIPKNLGGKSAAIYLLPGNYPNVTIVDFYNGQLTIGGASYDNVDTTRFIGGAYILVQGCQAQIEIRNVSVIDEQNVPHNHGIIEIINSCRAVKLTGVKVNVTKGYAVYASGAFTRVYLFRCTITADEGYAVGCAYCAELRTWRNNTISGSVGAFEAATIYLYAAPTTGSYSTTAGSRIYTGAQTNAPSY